MCVHAARIGVSAHRTPDGPSRWSLNRARRRHAGRGHQPVLCAYTPHESACPHTERPTSACQSGSRAGIGGRTGGAGRPVAARRTGSRGRRTGSRRRTGSYGRRPRSCGEPPAPGSGQRSGQAGDRLHQPVADHDVTTPARKATSTFTASPGGATSSSEQSPDRSAQAHDDGSSRRWARPGFRPRDEGHDRDMEEDNPAVKLPPTPESVSVARRFVLQSASSGTFSAATTGSFSWSARQSPTR